MGTTRTYTVEIQNVYEDGHKSASTLALPAPAEGQDLTDWFEEVVYPHTGDGHGIGKDLGSCYTATIIHVTGDTTEDLGEFNEWTD